MAKAAIYCEEAKRLYVVEGFSLDAIVGMMGKKVSRKTLYNWKIQGEWDAKRKEYLNQTKDLYAELIEIARLMIKEAKANPTSKNVMAAFRAASMLLPKDGTRIIEEETSQEERKGLTAEAIAQIEKEVGLL
ncbi:MAG: hypothetical protein M1510_11660 [Nitrospirae bacterium]|nr:hypothetical protein [Nitrospirota bacterium]